MQIEKQLLLWIVYTLWKVKEELYMDMEDETINDFIYLYIIYLFWLF